MDNKISTIPYKELRHYVSTPFILGMAVPLVFLDICLEIYHTFAFLLYGIPHVKRGEYIKIDRYKLSYLQGLDKAWCAYCGYANGLLAYAVEIGARTEKYWCGIKHKPDLNFKEPLHHKDFVEYGDRAALVERYGEEAVNEQCKLEKDARKSS